MEDDLLSAIFIGIFSLIIIITFIGCSFALSLFYYERKHRIIAYNFVISLCFGDIIHGCLGCAICIRFCIGSKAGDSTCFVQHAILLVASYITLMNWSLLGNVFFLFIITPKWRIRFLMVNVWLIKIEKNKLILKQFNFTVLIALGWIVAICLGIGTLGIPTIKHPTSHNENCFFISFVVEPIYIFPCILLVIYVAHAIGSYYNCE